MGSSGSRVLAMRWSLRGKGRVRNRAIGGIRGAIQSRVGEGGFDLVQGDAECGKGEGLEVVARALEVDGGLSVGVGFSGFEEERWAGTFDFVEGAERFGSRLGRAVVIGIDDIAGKRREVIGPLGIDVGPFGFCRIIGWIETDECEDAGIRLPAACDGFGCVWGDAEFAT